MAARQARGGLAASRRLRWRDSGAQCRALVLALLATCVLASVPGSAPAAQRVRVSIAYVEPKAAEHAAIYEALKTRRILEQIRDVLSPYRLPRKLTLKLEGCDGVDNAWYEPEEGVVTVCYEYIAHVVRDAPRETTPAGVTPDDAIVGPAAEVFLHEAAHALFDLLRIPLLGPEEAAADQVAAHMLLQFGPAFARRAIGGVAYMYATQAKQEKPDAKAAAGTHPLTPQRFYSLLCLAYGSDPRAFGDVVSKGYLPQSRADVCEEEYAQVDFAVKALFGPHTDKAQRKKVRAKFLRKFEGDAR